MTMILKELTETEKEHLRKELMARLEAWGRDNHIELTYTQAFRLGELIGETIQ